MSDLHDSPGVQGLAQLGRNAIDRVSELERGIAERDETIRQLQATLTKNAKGGQLLDRIADLEARLAEYEWAPTFTYMYRFPHMGGFVWRHSSADFNGAKPVESIALIARPTRKEAP